MAEDIYERISDAELGARVKAGIIKHQQKIEINTPQWQETGRQYKQMRKDLNITQKQISKYVGVSTQVVAKFEKGKSVRSRKMLQQSYSTAMTLIQTQRNNIFDNQNQ